MERDMGMQACLGLALEGDGDEMRMPRRAIMNPIP
jgi:hypothetical protein